MRVLIVRLLVLSTALAVGTGATIASARTARRQPVKIIVGAENVTVTPALDGSRSTTATVGPAGGTLSTTAQDGTTFQLTIPAGALAGAEQLTVTPLVSMARGGVKLIAGVQLAPDGLQLLKTAELAVTPARHVARASQVGFGYEGNGSEFGLMPLAVRSNIEIPVLSLGGFGVASATRGQTSRRQHHPPDDPTAAWLAQLAIPLRQIRSHRSVQANRRTVKGVIAAYYTGYVRPLLGSAGSSFAAWNEAATRGVGWLNEVQTLGDARQFPGYSRRLRSSIFNGALRRQWGAVTASCAANRALGDLQDALALARSAQALKKASNIGGNGAIAAALFGCAQLNLRAALNPTTVNWQSGLSSDRIFSDTVVAQIASTRLLLEQLLGTNEFTFASSPVGVTETISSWTQGATYAAQGCTKPSFVGFSANRAQMYGALAATLTVPADLFARSSPPPATVAVSVAGADLANWTTTCPPSQTTSFSQSPGAMSGLSAVTSLTPIRINSTANSNAKKFQGSADILAGATVAGYANGNGKITVSVVH